MFLQLSCIPSYAFIKTAKRSDLIRLIIPFILADLYKKCQLINRGNISVPSLPVSFAYFIHSKQNGTNGSKWQRTAKWQRHTIFYIYMAYIAHKT